MGRGKLALKNGLISAVISVRMNTQKADAKFDTPNMSGAFNLFCKVQTCFLYCDDMKRYFNIPDTFKGHFC